MDLPFSMLVLMLTLIGLVMMFSASYAFSLKEYESASYLFVRQGIFVAIGTGAMFVVSHMNYQIFRKLAVPLMVAALALLAAVPFIGKDSGGAKRWIDLGFTTFQPSEIAKLAVIICFSAMAAVFRERMKSFKYGVLPFVAILGAMSGLLILEPHLSGTVLILGVGAALMFVGGVRWGWFVGLAAIAAPAAWYLATHMEHAKARIAVWQDPWSDPRDKGLQAIQSLYAIGSGGLFGLGLGQSRQKYLYLPEEHNDFVFAIVCEELGLIGAGLILVLFAALILRGYWIALHARDRFGSLLVTGVTTLLALQTFLNVAVVTNLIPVTGMSMPFFSYGGTALLIQLVEMGIVLSVSRQIPAAKSG
ncbi:MAG: putative lipid II flippase FtsW [Oscillospiraceae bacterium]|nr:putative lipid II flippase FtsW [Oscillospiraceae bacterium]